MTNYTDTESDRVSDDDWQLAGQLMRMSDFTRAGCQRAMEQARRRDNRAKAYAADERDECVSDRKLGRCKEGIIRWLRKLPEDEYLARRDLMSKLKIDVRSYFDAAIAELTDQGEISEVQLEHGTGYTLGTAVQRSTAQSTCEDSAVPDAVLGTAQPDPQPAEQRKRNGYAPPPGGPNGHTPGYTERVQQIITKLEKETQK